MATILITSFTVRGNRNQIIKARATPFRQIRHPHATRTICQNHRNEGKELSPRSKEALRLQSHCNGCTCQRCYPQCRPLLCLPNFSRATARFALGFRFALIGVNVTFTTARLTVSHCRFLSKVLFDFPIEFLRQRS